MSDTNTTPAPAAPTAPAKKTKFVPPTTAIKGTIAGIELRLVETQLTVGQGKGTPVILDPADFSLDDAVKVLKAHPNAVKAIVRDCLRPARIAASKGAFNPTTGKFDYSRFAALFDNELSTDRAQNPLKLALAAQQEFNEKYSQEIMFLTDTGKVIELRDKIKAEPNNVEALGLWNSLLKVKQEMVKHFTAVQIAREQETKKQLEHAEKQLANAKAAKDATAPAPAPAH